MEKKPIVSVTYENESISIKNILPYDRFFFPYKSLYFECYATMPMLADAHISSLGYL